MEEKRYIDPIGLKMSIVLNNILNENKTLEEIIDNEPTAEVVSKSLFDQIKWERDVAVEQLKKLGLSIGLNIDGIYITKEQYKELLEYKHMYEDLCN